MAIAALGCPKSAGPRSEKGMRAPQTPPASLMSTIPASLPRRAEDRVVVVMGQSYNFVIRLQTEGLDSGSFGSDREEALRSIAE